MKIAAGVVLYNPTFDYIENIKQYNEGGIDKIYIFDNSDIKDEEIIKELDKLHNIKFIDNQGNKGIAVALNIIAMQAINEGYTHLLCMDQDSYWEMKEINKMIKSINQYENSFSQYAAVYAPEIERDKINNVNRFAEVKEVITSGSILNLDVYKKLGGFCEDYFIYCVDYEYCWRARKEGFKILKNNSVYFKHQTNDYDEKGTLIRETSKYAFYYASRNNCYLIKKFLFTNPFDAVIRFERFIRLWCNLLIKEKDREKSKFFVLGFVDFIRGRKGMCKF